MDSNGRILLRDHRICAAAAASFFSGSEGTPCGGADRRIFWRIRTPFSPILLCENKVVETAKLCVVSADMTDNSITEDVDSKFVGSFISGVGSFLNVAQVVAYAGDAKKTSALLKSFEDGVKLHALFQKEEDDKGIDIAAAVGRLDNTDLERKTEAGIDAFSVVDGAQRAAASQMTGDSFSGASIHGGKRFGHIAMGRAVIPLRSIPYFSCHSQGIP